METDLFDHVKDEKKRRILEAALREFSARGYAGTATRDITNSAEVSRGLLFYYFKDKNTLFSELSRICREHIITIYLSDLEEGLGFFDSLKQFCVIKLKLSVEYPEAYRLLLEEKSMFPERYQTEGRDFKHEIYKKLRITEENDDPVFKLGLDKKLAKEIIVSALEGLSTKLSADYAEGKLSMEEVLKAGVSRADEYLDFFREHFTVDT